MGYLEMVVISRRGSHGKVLWCVVRFSLVGDDGWLVFVCCECNLPHIMFNHLVPHSLIIWGVVHGTMQSLVSIPISDIVVEGRSSLKQLKMVWFKFCLNNLDWVDLSPSYQQPFNFGMTPANGEFSPNSHGLQFFRPVITNANLMCRAVTFTLPP